ncbi:unnamed protein product [Cuscuta campestris]|uniref:Uncharacterized protein n=1 Tax=Cuscuta campestris TaxID=132261 RepID=A0A484NJ50_9ASTE|nr:unnamed protein product [Cuscuta campestris]
MTHSSNQQKTAVVQEGSNKRQTRGKNQHKQRQTPPKTGEQLNETWESPKTAQTYVGITQQSSKNTWESPKVRTKAEEIGSRNLELVSRSEQYPKIQLKPKITNSCWDCSTSFRICLSTPSCSQYLNFGVQISCKPREITPAISAVNSNSD